MQCNAVRWINALSWVVVDLLGGWAVQRQDAKSRVSQVVCNALLLRFSSNGNKTWHEPVSTIVERLAVDSERRSFPQDNPSSTTHRSTFPCQTSRAAHPSTSLGWPDGRPGQLPENTSCDGQSSQTEKCWNITNIRDNNMRAFGLNQLMGFLPTLARQQGWHPYQPRVGPMCQVQTAWRDPRAPLRVRRPHGRQGDIPGQILHD